MKYTLGKTRFDSTKEAVFLAASYRCAGRRPPLVNCCGAVMTSKLIQRCTLAAGLSVRDRLLERWNRTQETITAQGLRRAYYLSMEYLLGRSLRNAVCNLGLKSEYAQAVERLGYKLEDLFEEELEAALGTAGLGRLAACFMESAATMGLPVWAYGIRYTYGLFEQQFM